MDFRFGFEFQPIKNLNNCIYAYEALLRDEQGFLPDIICAAQHNKELAIKIDRWVIHNAIAQWKNQERKEAIAINCTPFGLASKGFVQAIVDLNRDTNIIVELTEYGEIEYLDLFEAINFLKNQQIKVFCDDFGAVNNGIKFLASYPFEGFKIDKSILLSSRIPWYKKRRILLSMAQMSKLLGCKMIVEGIESPRLLSICTESDIEFVQGYLYQKEFLNSLSPKKQYIPTLILTPRQQQIVELISKGITTTSEIARVLGIKPNTINKQIQLALSNNCLNSRMQLGLLFH